MSFELDSDEAHADAERLRVSTLKADLAKLGLDENGVPLDAELRAFVADLKRAGRGESADDDGDWRGK